MDSFRINRGVMPDRIQVLVSPNYKTANDNRDKYFEILTPLFQKEIQKDCNIKMERYKGRKFIVLNDDLLKQLNFDDYVKHLRMSVSCPYSVSMEFNGIRYIKTKVMNDTDRFNFNFKKDEKIRIHENNFLNKEVWNDFDRRFCTDSEFELSDVIKNVSVTVWDTLFNAPTEHDLKPKFVSITKIEFNDEYFVGVDNSYNVMKRIKDLLDPKGLMP